jgi:hemerythrin
MLEWKDSYSVGVASLDKQHRSLLDFINSLPESEDFGEALNFLSTYVNEHFLDEERLLSAAYYSDLEAHREGHARFISWLDALRNKVAANPAETEHLIRETTEYLGKWLVDHILKSDMSYDGVIR